MSKYNELIYSQEPAAADDQFGIAACPRCGGSSLKRSSAEDTAHGRLYHFIE